MAAVDSANERLLVLVLHGAAAFRTKASGEWKQLRLRKNLLRLLVRLVLEEAVSVETGVPLKNLAVTEGAARVELSRLRAVLPSDALPHAKKDRVWLDKGVVESDWWQFREALGAGKRKKHTDPYRASHHFYAAERAFVRSRRLMETRCRWILDEARANPPLYLKDLVAARWDNRRDIVRSLRTIGHVDRAVLEYEIYEETLERDDFFGYVVPHQELHDLGTETIDLAAGSTTLAARLRQDRGAMLSVPDDARVEEHRIGVTDALKRTREDRGIERGRRRGAVLDWDDVNRLFDLLLKRLVDAAGEFRPHVVVGIGRDGTVPATMLSHALECRLQGWIAVSRYQYGVASEHASKVREVELPLVRARRILLVDDLLFSGRSTIAAIERLRHAYPDAKERIVVAALLNDSSHPLRVPMPAGVRSIAGMDYPISEKRLWVEFPWEQSRLRRTVSASSRGAAGNEREV